MRGRRGTRNNRGDGFVEAPRLGRVEESDLDSRSALGCESWGEGEISTHLHCWRATIVRHTRVDEVVPNVRIGYGADGDLYPTITKGYTNPRTIL